MDAKDMELHQTRKDGQKTAAENNELKRKLYRHVKKTRHAAEKGLEIGLKISESLGIDESQVVVDVERTTMAGRDSDSEEIDESEMEVADPWVDKKGYEQFHSFNKRLEHLIGAVPKYFKRKNFTNIPTFSAASKRRLFDYGIGMILEDDGNRFNIDNSPSKHRLKLVLLSEPIFRIDVFTEMKDCYTKQEKFLCAKLSEDYIEDNHAVYSPISGDPFALPEVCLFSMIFFL
jgi:hypothetical protein